MSSLKMTFSLTSLIFLIALGLVFGTTSVMAHDGSVGNLDHGHPLTKTLPAKDLNDDDDTTDVGEPAVNPHDVHPVVTSIVPEASSKASVTAFKGRQVILLEADGDPLTIPAADGTAPGNGVFKVKVTFDKELAGTEGLDAGDTFNSTAPTDTANNEVVYRVFRGTTEVTSGITSAAVTAPEDDDKSFVLTLTVGQAQFWTTTAGSLLPLEVYIDIAENAVLTPTGRLGGTALAASGNGSYRSPETMKLTIVPSFDETGPVPTFETPTFDKAKKQAVFEMKFSEKVKAGTLSASDFTFDPAEYVMADAATVMPDTTDATMLTYELRVPIAAATQGTLTATLKKNSVMDLFGNMGPAAATVSGGVVLPDNIKPTVTITMLSKTPAGKHMLDANGKVRFQLDFSEPLAKPNSISSLEVSDFDITDHAGGDLEAELGAPQSRSDGTERYLLTVDAGTDPQEVHIELDPTEATDDSVEKNTVDASMPETLKSVFDTVPPTVVITAPAAPLTSGDLRFTLDFSEEIIADTIASNAFDRSGPSNYTWTSRSKPKKDSTDPTIYTIDVDPKDPTKKTIVQLLGGSVTDLAMNAIVEDTIATFVPKTPGPDFVSKMDDIDVCVTDIFPRVEKYLLPKGSDEDPDDLTYTLMRGSVEVPNRTEDTAPAKGLYWETIERQHRYLRGIATADDTGTYTWTVTDENGRTDTDTFKVTVHAFKPPERPADLEAMKVDSDSEKAATMDRVRLSWDVPANKRAYPDCIPPVTSYTVMVEKLDEAMGPDGWDPSYTLPTGYKSTFAIADLEKEAGRYEVSLATLSAGIYRFSIKAHNAATTDSRDSDYAEWAKTGGKRVVLANVPKAPQDLERVTLEGTAVTLNWLRVPDVDDGGAPIHDDVDDDDEKVETARAMYYGADVDGDFGGYVLIRVNKTSGEITRFPADPDGEGTSLNADTVEDDDNIDLLDDRFYTHPTVRIKNLERDVEYLFRVFAMNVAGQSPDSNEITVYIDPVTDPVTKAPDFGDSTIPSLIATQNQPIAGRILPRATDADTPAASLTYTIEDASGSNITKPAGLTFDASALTLTGSPPMEMPQTAYIYKVADPEGNEATITFFITVKAAATTPTGPHLIAAHANGVTTISGTLNSNSFATVGASDFPNIQRFFAEGGSISVLSSQTGAVAKDVVISEIMWGLDLNQGASNQDNQQFIELYNTTNAAINLSMVTIEFDSAKAVPAVPSGRTLLDQVSNVSGAGWLITDAPGSNGRIPTATNTGSANLVSMYRNIDYNKVEKTDHDADAKKNRDAQLKDFPNGNALGSWKASNVVDTYGLNLIGSPRAKHFVPYTPLTASAVDRTLVIINEIGNHSDDTYDWVELRNVSGSEVNLKKWELSQVTSDKKDSQLVSFPDNDNHKIPAGGILLLVNSDPYRDTSHPIAAGSRINGGGEKTGLTARYYVDGGLKLANSGDTLLILRNANDKEGKAEAFKDVVGTLSIADDTADFRTKMWPLAATGAAHGNVIDGDKDNKEDDFRSGRVYQRNDASGGTGEKDLAIVGYTGVGYKRSAANNGQNGGTPGYANDAVKVNVSDLASDATVTISEIMYAKGRNLPQWIELYNSSMTQAVNISEWKLRIDNLRGDRDIDIRSPSVTTNNFGGGVTIQPNQTVLIVSGKTRRDSRSAQAGVDFPDTRVVDLWGQKDRIEVAAKRDDGSNTTNLNYQLLSEEAFSLTLLDKGGAIVDTVGNLDTDRETVLWDLPSVEGMAEGRSSIIRRTDGDEKPHTADDSRDGMMERAWILASKTNLAEVPYDDTYYGSPTDIGTPGYRGGGPLPVSLSKFRPERLDSGEIVVRWITESELNNAGFNILRSEKRDGEFTKVHFVAGKGTTTERSTYEWKDTTAKPNVVYYYQIQDISLDGKVTTLRQSRLKGNVTAAGKITTTWGDIKALQ